MLCTDVDKSGDPFSYFIQDGEGRIQLKLTYSGPSSGGSGGGGDAAAATAGAGDCECCWNSTPVSALTFLFGPPANDSDPLNGNVDLTDEQREELQQKQAAKTAFRRGNVQYSNRKSDFQVG